jgi:Mg/Co/Ni transporter MgtE
MLPVPQIPYTEIALAIIAIVMMVKVAEFENRSGLLWGCVTFALVFCSMWFFGRPFVRVIVAAGLAFGAMTAAKMLSDD